MILLLKRARRQQSVDPHGPSAPGRLASGPEAVRAVLVTAPPRNALTERDLDVLDLLEARLSHKEIAACLEISVPTVEWHAANTYRKLRLVNSRSAMGETNTPGLPSWWTGRHGNRPEPRVVPIRGSTCVHCTPVEAERVW
jgi:ATP/maltotriose-dependent transcriptional regulator MalT